MSSAKWRPFCLGLNVLILSAMKFVVGSSHGWIYTTQKATFDITAFIQLDIALAFKALLTKYAT